VGDLGITGESGRWETGKQTRTVPDPTDMHPLTWRVGPTPAGEVTDARSQNQSGTGSDITETLYQTG